MHNTKSFLDDFFRAYEASSQLKKQVWFICLIIVTKHFLLNIEILIYDIVCCIFMTSTTSQFCLSERHVWMSSNRGAKGKAPVHNKSNNDLYYHSLIVFMCKQSISLFNDNCTVNINNTFRRRHDSFNNCKAFPNITINPDLRGCVSLFEPRFLSQGYICDEKP